MNNPFKQQPKNDKPNRIPYDLSFNNNLTANFGKIYPVMCKEVIPGDTFNIEPIMGFRMMPMAFPVQTRIKADLHFFYVRSRNLWDGFQDFITRGKDDQAVPYIQTSDSSKFTTGSLADYLGVPTTIGGNFSSYWMSLMSSNQLRSRQIFPLPTEPNIELGGMVDFNQKVSDAQGCSGTKQYSTLSAWRPISASKLFTLNDLMSEQIATSGTPGTLTDYYFTYSIQYLSELVKSTSKIKVLGNNGAGTPTRLLIFVDNMTSFNSVGHLNVPHKDVLIGAADLTFSADGMAYSSQPLMNINGYHYQNNAAVSRNLYAIINEQIEKGRKVKIALAATGSVNTYGIPTAAEYRNLASNIQITDTDITSIADTANFPTAYIGASPLIKLNALPFRAYESIFNGFFRNQQVDPFKINGIPEYNKFCTNRAGGADSTTPLDFNFRYWEDDPFTTCVPSPQQGIAPLVGMRNPDDVGYRIETEIGGTPTSIDVMADNEDNMTMVTRYPDNVSDGMREALEQAIQIGISINDFRNVNSLQRWLEKNIRNGYRYKDQIQSHFGVKVRYDELDMPEYLGGLSENITIQSITSTTQNQDAVLGAYAGQGSLFAKSKHKINNYFDEHGYVIAVLSFVPIPTYSQNLPKHFFKFSPLDHFFPEFNHIGFQPVTQREVAPLQSVNAGTSLDATFGYQRPWYEYLYSLDEVHGDMRLSLRDFLINRVYGNVPELSQDFLQIKPSETNNVFSVREENEDKIVGQIHFKITALRPISLYAEGRLE